MEKERQQPLGIVLRAVGHGMKVGMIQFIKGEWYYGELTSARRLEPEFDFVAAGKGFVGIIDDDHNIQDHKNAAKVALDLIRKKMSEKKYDILILDEIIMLQDRIDFCVRNARHPKA